ncbi:hypothetical protein WJX84_001509, partial [Apatococcus fuscideae]
MPDDQPVKKLKLKGDKPKKKKRKIVKDVDAKELHTALEDAAE